MVQKKAHSSLIYSQTLYLRKLKPISILNVQHMVTVGIKSLFRSVLKTEVPELSEFCILPCSYSW